MKQLLAGATALFFALIASATTYNPIQLLNPAGSTSGQAIVSTGASTSPTWANITVSNVTGAAPLASPTFTGAVTIPSGASIAGFATLASPTFTGVVTIPSGASIAGYASLASPTFTGTVTAAAVLITGNLTPSQTNGIIGTTTNNSPVAGSVGELVSSSIPIGSAVPLTTGTVTNVTSISLTAGDWDVWGNVWTAPSGSTSQTLVTGAISQASATLPTVPAGGAVAQFPYTAVAGIGVGMFVGQISVRLASTTTIYLVTAVSFSGSTNAAYGFIGARRRR